MFLFQNGFYEVFFQWHTLYQWNGSISFWFIHFNTLQSISSAWQIFSYKTVGDTVHFQCVFFIVVLNIINYWRMIHKFWNVRLFGWKYVRIHKLICYSYLFWASQKKHKSSYGAICTCMSPSCQYVMYMCDYYIRCSCMYMVPLNSNLTPTHDSRDSVRDYFIQ